MSNEGCLNRQLLESGERGKDGLYRQLHRKVFETFYYLPEVELPSVHARTGGRTLHPGRSVLSGA